MKFAKKFVSIAAAGALLAGILSGCGTPGSQASGTPEVLPEGVPADVVQETLGIPRDTVVATVNGGDITAEEVLYWVGYSADQASQYTGTIDWEQDLDGVSTKEYVLNNAVETAKLYEVVWQQAQERSCLLSDEDQADYDAQVSSLKEQLLSANGEDADADADAEYLRWLAYIGISTKSFDMINQTPYIFTSLKNNLFSSETLSGDAMDQWLEENGVIRAKHILVMAEATQDEAGTVTDDGMAAALTKANEIRAELKTGGDTEEKFDELMERYTADISNTGTVNNPEGYVFDTTGALLSGQGSLVTEFTNGAAALELNQVSEPVQSTFGYHILLRLDADTDTTRTQYGATKMNEQADQWMEETEVEKTADFDKLDAATYYTALTALRAEMSAAAQPEPSATPAPSTSPTPAA